MPRKPPAAVRATLQFRPRRHPRASTIRGVPPYALALIARLEFTRHDLGFYPGKVAASLRLWRCFVSRPNRRLWVDQDIDCGVFECCGSPWEARWILQTVVSSMSPRSSRELRRILHDLDARY